MIFDYILTLAMALEIFIAEFLFLYKTPRRPYYWMRVIGSLLVILFVTFDIQLIFTLASGLKVTYGEPSSISVSIFKFFFYFAIFAMTIVASYLTYKVSFLTILLYCAVGYAMQHIAANIDYLFQYLPFYGIITFQNQWMGLLYELIIVWIVYFFIHHFFIKGKPYVKGKAESMKKRVVLSLMVIILCIGLSRITKDNPQRGFISLLAESLYAIISNIFVLFLLNVLSRNDALDEKVDVMEEMLHREKQQYLQSKENIELINIKVHDLKHQIMLLKKDNSAERFSKVEKAIKIYDSRYRTGNDALDVILTDKSLQCEKNKITLTCACDGKLLSFIEETDIYSLFGNALSNAIESVQSLKDLDKRCISLNVSTKANMLSIHVENYFEGDIDFENGLPMSKKDQSWHGFGMKSMSVITQKYKGSLICSTDEDIFYLDIVIPIP